MISTHSQPRIDRHPPRVLACEESLPGLSRYRLLDKIGEGGMGVVYLAENLASQQSCAVKVIRPDKASDSKRVARFQFEIDVLRRWTHPNIVRLIDAERNRSGSRYFAMEYVAGANLDETVRRHGPLAPGRVVQIMRRLCWALGEVHACEIVHNDIKPANVLQVDHGQHCDGIKLIDFGLSRSLRAPVGSSGLEPDGAFAGSPLFASPESYTGTTDVRSDIYSLGATAYYLLTGRPVFDEDQPLAAIRAHVVCDPISFQSLGCSVDPALDAIVMRCLNKSPEHRFQTAEELDAALAQT